MKGVSQVKNEIMPLGEPESSQREELERRQTDEPDVDGSEWRWW